MQIPTFQNLNCNDSLVYFVRSNITSPQSSKNRFLLENARMSYSFRTMRRWYTHHARQTNLFKMVLSLVSMTCWDCPFKWLWSRVFIAATTRLNMLIDVMNNEFTGIRDRERIRFVKARAAAIGDVEIRMSSKMKQKIE